jgi:hypothetical protein
MLSYTYETLGNTIMEENWTETASNILKAELKRKKMTYDMLHEHLLKLGIAETSDGIKVKIHRGTFQFAFFLQCAVAMDLKHIRFEDIIEKYSK